MLGILCSAWQLQIIADEAPRPTPHERPRLPAQLDRAALQKVLDTIQEPHIASTLKIGYFGGRRSTRSLPMAEGFALLKAALEKEPVASKRWFLLQGVRGWAGFRNQGIGSDESFAAYEAIFAQADKAKAAGAVYALQQAIADYLMSAAGAFRRMGLNDDERAGAVLAKAWLAYAEHQRATGGKWNGPPPEWTRAFKALTLPEGFVAQVDKVLADASVPKTYSLLASAAWVLDGDEQPARAVELLQQAKPLLPADNPREATRFFDQLTALLRVQNKTKEATAARQEEIKLTGRGHAKLLAWQLENNDDDGAAATLALLMQPQAPEPEILAAAALLNNRWDKDKAKKNAKAVARSEALLNSYLKAVRTRTVPAELEARWRLGWILMQQKKSEEAKVALNIEALKVDTKRLDSNTRFFLDSIQALREKAEAGK